jgi:hypothetical protein
VTTVSLATMSTDEVSEAVELQDVRYLEISARTVEESDPASEQAAEPLIELMYRSAPGSFHARAVLKARGADVSLTIDAVAHFTWPTNQELSGDAVEAFMLHTGTTVLYPYLQTAAADMTQRLGVEPLLLPFFKPGSLSAEGTLRVRSGPRQQPAKRVAKRRR